MATSKQQPSLDGVYDKIRRANRHRIDLQQMLSAYDGVKTHAFTGEVRAQGYKHIYRWDDPPVLDPDIDLVFGDAIHNLRSALDHLAHQLVVLNKQVPNTTTAFPIFDAPPGRRLCRQCGNWTQRPLISPGVSLTALFFLNEVQPYQGGQIGLRLRQLRDLDNIDKHRHLIATLSATHFVGTEFTGDEPPYGWPDTICFPKRPVHGEIAAIIRYPKPRPELDPNLEFTTLVSIDKRAGRGLALLPVRDTLATIFYFVEDRVIGERLAPLFA